MESVENLELIGNDKVLANSTNINCVSLWTSVIGIWAIVQKTFTPCRNQKCWIWSSDLWGPGSRRVIDSPGTYLWYRIQNRNVRQRRSRKNWCHSLKVRGLGSEWRSWQVYWGLCPENRSPDRWSNAAHLCHGVIKWTLLSFAKTSGDKFIFWTRVL